MNKYMLTINNNNTHMHYGLEEDGRCGHLTEEPPSSFLGAEVKVDLGCSQQRDIMTTAVPGEFSYTLLVRPVLFMLGIDL